MKVREVMSRNVVRCALGDSLEQAAKLMWEGDCGCLPVVDDTGEVVGMITDRDVCMAAYTRGIRLSEAKVGSVISGDVYSTHPEQDIDKVEATMAARQIRRMPVIEMGALVGIVTVGDLARYAEAHPVKGALSSPALTKTMAAIVHPRAHSAHA